MRCAIPLVLALLWSIVPALAQEENPVFTEVKAALKDPTKPFTMLVQVKVKEGASTKFEAAFAPNRAGSRKEKGNLAYEMSRSTKDATEYIVYERWKNLDALQGHFKEPHFLKMIADAGDLLAGPPQVKVYVPASE